MLRGEGESRGQEGRGQGPGPGLWLESVAPAGGSPQPLGVAGAVRRRHLRVDGRVPCAGVELVAW